MEEPNWVTEARREFTPEQGVNEHKITDICRGFLPMTDIQKHLIDTGILPDKIDMLLIGAGINGRSGFDDVDLLCPYEVFNVFAYLSSLELDFSLTVVDIEQSPLDDIASRDHIFVTAEFLRDSYSELINWRKCAWERYLEMTNNCAEYTRTPMPGLQTRPSDSRRIFQGGVYYAPIPDGFKEAIKDGKVKLLNTNICDSVPGQYNMVLCSNVLFDFQTPAQMLAYHNLYTSLRKPGCLYLMEALPNAKHPHFQPILATEGGWLTYPMISELGLRFLDNSKPYPLMQAVMFLK